MTLNGQSRIVPLDTGDNLYEGVLIMLQQPITRRQFIKTTTAVSAAMLCPTFAAATRRPNILFLMADQLRGDCLRCAGNNAIKTPNLDSIAADGVFFSNAYTSTPSCTPARSAILTGLSPWRHGMLGYSRIADGYPLEMPTGLRNAGYYLCGIGKMHWWPQRKLRGYHQLLLDESGRAETKGFVSDYRQWFKAQAPDLNPDATGLGWNDYREGVYTLPERLHPTRWTADRAVEFIESYDRTEPFMLKVSFARPHSPYDPPQRFLDMYETSEMPAPSVGDWAARYADVATPPPPGTWKGDLGVEQARKSRRAYYASVTFIDEQIGRILEAVRSRNLYDDTLIVFFADHGDMLGDHNLWRKTYAYEGSASIPMMIKWHRALGRETMRGKTLTQPVELRDILPTFFDAAGLPVPEDIDGASMLDLVRGKTDKWREWIDLEHSRCYGHDSWNALTDGRVKYIYYARGHEELFDLENDPGELHDLAADPAHRQRLEKWRSRMAAHLAERGPEYVTGGKLLPHTKNMLHSPNYPPRQSNPASR